MLLVTEVLKAAFTLSFMFAIPLAVDRPAASPWQCVGVSVRFACANVGNLFLFIFYALGVLIVFLLCLGVGVFPAMAIVLMSVSVMYSRAVGLGPNDVDSDTAAVTPYGPMSNQAGDVEQG